MAKIDYSKNKDGADIYGILLTFCGLICMVSVILGIKFKWFKHRLNFESSLNQLNPATTSNDTTKPEIFRSTATTYKTTPFEVGVFRQKSGDEYDLERPKVLPPIKIIHQNSSKKLLTLPKNQQKSPNSLSLKSQKHTRTDEKIAKPSVHGTKSNSESNKTNRNRSNSKSPKKDNRENKQIETKKNIETSSTKKNILLTNNSELPTLLNKEKTERMSTKESSSNNHKIENKKKIKKKIKFENVSNESFDQKSTNLQRRPTGFTKLSKEELEELEALSEQTPDSPISGQRRRPTGFELLSKEEFDELEDLANNEGNTIEKKFNSIQFHNFEENETINSKVDAFSTTRKKEDEYGFLSINKNENSFARSDLNNYPGGIGQDNDDLTFKITGFSDNEEDDKELCSNLKTTTQKIKISPYYKEDSRDNSFENKRISPTNRPEPQPRTTLRQSKEINKISNNSIFSSEPSSNGTDGYEQEDGWSAVRNYRNLTEEMVQHNQAIRDAAKEKAARRELRNPLAYDDIENTSIKPKNMKNVKRIQHENEEREKKSQQTVNLNNDNSDISC